MIVKIPAHSSKRFSKTVFSQALEFSPLMVVSPERDDAGDLVQLASSTDFKLIPIEQVHEKRVALNLTVGSDRGHRWVSSNDEQVENWIWYVEYHELYGVRVWRRRENRKENERT